MTAFAREQAGEETRLTGFSKDISWRLYQVLYLQDICNQVPFWVSVRPS